MVRRYEPVHKTEYGRYDDFDFHYAEMKEAKEGNWVKLKTFKDEQKRLQSEIDRLKLKYNQTIEELKRFY